MKQTNPMWLIGALLCVSLGSILVVAGVTVVCLGNFWLGCPQVIFGGVLCWFWGAAIHDCWVSP